MKESWLSISDNTNIRWVKIFHLYKGFWRKSTKIGFFIKSSARVVEPPRIEYKGFKYKYNLKGDICRVVIICSRKKLPYADGLVSQLGLNSGIVIKKKSDPRSKHFKGPINSSLKRKRLETLFSYVI